MKKIIILLSVVVLLFVATPISSIYAYQGGLLDNKPMGIGTGTGLGTGKTTTITDNDPNTYFELARSEGTFTDNDTLWYEFDCSKNITGYRLKADSSNPAIYLRKADNTFIELQHAKKDESYVSIDYKDITAVSIQTLGAKSKIYELDVFGTDGSNCEAKPEIGNRAILVVTMMTGLEKEYDLSMDEVNAFLNWYEAKSNGVGSAKFAIDKHDNNKGPFSSRKDYVIFDKILTFEVSEYTTK
ncbi:hypothetical protein [Paenibacillus agilis]|uniref:hypothetical protein n=1 Tax=Paenibacillus agilis TaxID=3020863 RepID=UPI0021BD97CB|nr:hypothetical protein [Paenibacillus agilis]